MKYIPVIGLEIHAELLTQSKMYCSCANIFGGTPNSNTCPVCTGMPGTLPTVNKEAVILAVKAGIALNCKINNASCFDRKNYFYPDLPKAYQITQFYHPITGYGCITINNNDFRINHLHLEEDAGKLIHDNNTSSINYNRCGVPLIEIVTEHDFRSAKDVQAFVEEVALRLKYAGVCDGKMEEGSLRVDVNISLMPENSENFGTRAEIKNINSIKAIGKAVDFEIKRQSGILDSGMTVAQETRRFDEKTGETYSMRSKEEANDYRYFPEPDIPTIFLTDVEIKEIQNSMPEMAHTRFKRYTQEYKLTDEEARLLISDRLFSDFYDNTVKIRKCYKKAASLMLVGLNKLLNSSPSPLSRLKFTEKELAELSLLWENNLINSNSAMEILDIMFNHGGNPEAIAKDNDMIMSCDTTIFENAINTVLEENKDAVSDYKSGNKRAFGFIMGKVMAKLGKTANPAVIKEILENCLK